MFRLIRAELGLEYIDVPSGENVLGRGPFLKVRNNLVLNGRRLFCASKRSSSNPYSVRTDY